MRLVHPHTRRRRATGALGIVTIVLGALAIQFFRVQMLQSNDYMLQSESNRLRPLPVAAPRGTIFDRNDRVIADNPDQARDVRDGKEKTIGWFVGQVMQATGGKANPKMVNELLRKKLSG